MFVVSKMLSDKELRRNGNYWAMKAKAWLTETREDHPEELTKAYKWFDTAMCDHPPAFKEMETDGHWLGSCRLGSRFTGPSCWEETGEPARRRRKLR